MKAQEELQETCLAMELVATEIRESIEVYKSQIVGEQDDEELLEVSIAKKHEASSAVLGTDVPTEIRESIEVYKSRVIAEEDDDSVSLASVLAEELNKMPELQKQSDSNEEKKLEIVEKQLLEKTNELSVVLEELQDKSNDVVKLESALQELQGLLFEAQKEAENLKFISSEKMEDALREQSKELEDIIKERDVLLGEVEQLRQLCITDTKNEQLEENSKELANELKQVKLVLESQQELLAKLQKEKEDLVQDALREAELRQALISEQVGKAVSEQSEELEEITRERDALLAELEEVKQSQKMKSLENKETAGELEQLKLVATTQQEQLAKLQREKEDLVQDAHREAEHHQALISEQVGKAVSEQSEELEEITRERDALLAVLEEVKQSQKMKSLENKEISGELEQLKLVAITQQEQLVKLQREKEDLVQDAHREAEHRQALISELIEKAVSEQSEELEEITRERDALLAVLEEVKQSHKSSSVDELHAQEQKEVVSELNRLRLLVQSQSEELARLQEEKAHLLHDTNKDAGDSSKQVQKSAGKHAEEEQAVIKKQDALAAEIEHDKEAGLNKSDAVHRDSGNESDELTEVNQLKEIVKSQSEDLLELLKEKEDWKSSDEQMKKALQEQQQELEELHKENKKWQLAVETYQETVTELEQQLVDKKRELVENKKNMDLQFEQLENRIIELESERVEESAGSEAVEKLQEQLQSIEDRLQSDRNSYETQLAQLEKNKAANEQELENLQKSNDHLSNLVENLQLNCAEKTAEASQLCEVVKQLEAELELAKEDIAKVCVLFGSCLHVCVVLLL